MPVRKSAAAVYNTKNVDRTRVADVAVRERDAGLWPPPICGTIAGGSRPLLCADGRVLCGACK